MCQEGTVLPFCTPENWISSEYIGFPKAIKAVDGRTRSIPWMLLQRACFLCLSQKELRPPLPQLTGGIPRAGGHVISYMWGKGISALSVKAEPDAHLRQATFGHLGGLVSFLSQIWGSSEVPGSSSAHGQGHWESQLPLGLQWNTVPWQFKDGAFLQGHFALGLKLGDDAHHQI